MKRNSATDKASPDPTYEVSRGETITAWIVSGLIRADFPGVAAPAEDRVDYRFINGFVDVGDLPCRKAFQQTMIDRDIAPENGFMVSHLNLPGSNRRVEFTGFWHVPTHVQRWLKGTFRSEAARQAHFRLRTCGGVRIWVGGVEQVLHDFLLAVDGDHAASQRFHVDTENVAVARDVGAAVRQAEVPHAAIETQTGHQIDRDLL